MSKEENKEKNKKTTKPNKQKLLQIYWVGQKVPSVSKYKEKIHFSFSPRTLLNNLFTISFHYVSQATS